MRNNGSPEPLFETDDERTYFSTTLYIHPDFGKHQDGGVINGVINLKPNEERLIEYIKAHPNATIAELAESMKVGTSTVDRAVKSLKQKGVLDRKGGNIAHMNQIRTLPETVSLPTASTWACTSSSEMAKAGWQNRQDTCRHSVIRNAVVGRFLYC